MTMVFEKKKTEQEKDMSTSERDQRMKAKKYEREGEKPISKQCTRGSKQNDKKTEYRG